ncbi:hypothetical protein GCM10028791_32330 [Echinicola sediminis]
MAFLISHGNILAHQYAYAGLKRQQDLENVKVSMKMKDASIVEVLRNIEASTIFHVAFMEEQLSKEKNITISAHKRSLLKVLEELSRDYNLKFTQVNNTIHVAPKKQERAAVVQVEERTVSGRVIDDMGEPIPGVN